MLALAVWSSAFTSVAIATGFERRYGVLERLAATPLGRTGLLAGKALAVVLVVLGQLRDPRPAPRWCWAGARAHRRPSCVRWSLVLLAAATFVGLALLLAGRLRAEATLALANLVYVVLLVGGALVLPLTATPAPLQPVIELLPTAALGEGLRAAAPGRPSAGRCWSARLVRARRWPPGRVSDGRPDRTPRARRRRACCDWSAVSPRCAAGPSPRWWPTSASSSPAALVRLTASGMGCPTWPRCTEDSYVSHPALGLHGAIEFGNRLLTFVLVVIAVLTWVTAMRTATDGRAAPRPPLARRRPGPRASPRRP